MFHKRVVSFVCCFTFPLDVLPSFINVWYICYVLIIGFMHSFSAFSYLFVRLFVFVDLFLHPLPGLIWKKISSVRLLVVYRLFHEFWFRDKTGHRGEDSVSLNSGMDCFFYSSKVVGVLFPGFLYKGWLHPLGTTIFW